MTPKQDELAVPERIWLAQRMIETLGVDSFLVPPNMQHLCVEYLRKQSVIDRLKKKRDEWDRSSFAEMGNQRLIEKARLDAANELIAEFEKE